MKAKIYYCDIGDYLTRNEKLAFLTKHKSFLSPDMGLIELAPNEHGDWITTRNEAFYEYTPLASEKKFDVKSETYFVVNSRGFETARDSWIYNYSQKTLLENIQGMIEFYNSQLKNEEPNYDSTRISWSRSLLGYHKNGHEIKFEEEKVTSALYRPFCQQQAYFGERVINVRGQFNEFFPTADIKNLIIMVSGLGGSKDHSVLISNGFVDLNCQHSGTQCFPLYYYELQDDKGGQGSLFDDVDNDTPQYIRKDGVSDYILKQARVQYGAAVTKEDVFFYVYGYLHSPAYRTTFADDLKKSLPRIPLVETAEQFWVFSKAGQELAELHLNYEEVEPLNEVEVKGDSGNYHVEKMRFKSKADKSVIVYNSAITVENIPLSAYEYVVNGKSAIEWVMERYQVKTDKASGIVNDPNLYAEECENPRYILDLLLSVVAVSVRTVEIVEGLL
jgi:predicted helicase